MTAGQTNWPYVINLGNSIIGVSVLAMPFCFKQCGVVLGMLLLICSAWLTDISCKLLVKAAFHSRRRSYQYLAFHAVGQVGKLFVEFCMIGLLLGTCSAFYVVMGDLGPAILSKMMGIENTDNLRTGMLVVMAICISLPLAMLRNVESLSNINAISLGFYTVFVAEVFTAALPNLWSGLWVTKVSYWNPEGVFKCLPIFALAFSCQTQLFVMYDALPEPNLQRMNHIAKSAVGMCLSVYLLVGFFGYVAFCDDVILGDIMLNFHPTIFSEAVKMGFVLSVAVSFPLVVFPCRASIYTMFFAKDQGLHDNISGSLVIPPFHFKLITTGIVLGTMVVGIMVPNIEFVLALTGSTMGSMICFIFPAVMFISIMSMTKSANKATAQFVLFLGVTILLASTYVTMNAQVQQVTEAASVIKVAAQEDAGVPGAGPGPVKDGAGDDNDGQHAGDGPLGDDKGGGGDKIKRDGGKADSAIVGKVGNDIREDDKDVHDMLIEDRAQNLEEDKRHEPPNPQAPLDANAEDKKSADDADKEKEKVKEPEKDTEKKDSADKQTDKKVDDTKEEKAEDQAEAKNLLKELKEQQQEQKKLIEEQKQIIEDLKQHRKDAHGEDVPSDQVQDSKQLVQDQGPAIKVPADAAQQQQVPVAQQQIPAAAQQQVPAAAQQQVPAAAQQQVPAAAQQQIPVAAQQIPAAQQQIPDAQAPAAQQMPAAQPAGAAQKQAIIEQQLKPVAEQPAPVVPQQPVLAPQEPQQVVAAAVQNQNANIVLNAKAAAVDSNAAALKPDINKQLGNLGNAGAQQFIEQPDNQAGNGLGAPAGIGASANAANSNVDTKQNANVKDNTANNKVVDTKKDNNNQVNKANNKNSKRASRR